MNRIFGVALICLATLTVSAQTANATRFQIDRAHTKWIDNALRSMQRIRVGGTKISFRCSFFNTHA